MRPHESDFLSDPKAIPSSWINEASSCENEETLFVVWKKKLL